MTLREVGRHGLAAPAFANWENSSTSPFSDSTSPTIGRAFHRRGFLRGRGAGKMPPEPLGTQLDRGQRVLDLVSEPARHLTPGGDLLRPDERRDVVEHQHGACGRARFADQRRRDDGEMELLAVARYRDLLGGGLAPAPPGPGQQGRDRFQIGARESRLDRLATLERLSSQQARQRRC